MTKEERKQETEVKERQGEEEAPGDQGCGYNPSHRSPITSSSYYSLCLWWCGVYGRGEAPVERRKGRETHHTSKEVISKGLKVQLEEY